jgi:hypothetical protein
MTQVQMVRLIADEGKLLTDGEFVGKVIDVCPAEDANKWYEIDAPEEEREIIESEQTEGE